MICEIMFYSSNSVTFAKLIIVVLLNILYVFRHILFKYCVLFLFRRINFGNISIIERKSVLREDYALEQVDKELVNVVNNETDPTVILYITNEKFYENFLFYGERGLEMSHEKDFITENLYELFEIIFAPPTHEWLFYKKFVQTYNDMVKTKIEPLRTFTYNDEEFLFIEEELPPEIKIVIHNGNFDFKNTSIGHSPLTDGEISKKIKYHRMERFIPTLEGKTYQTTFLRFLFQNNYLSCNYYFCKK